MGPGGNYSEHPLPLGKLWILHFCSQASPNLTFPNLHGVAHLQDLSAHRTRPCSSADGLRVSTCSSLVQWDFARLPGGIRKFYSCRKWGPVRAGWRGLRGLALRGQAGLLEGRGAGCRQGRGSPRPGPLGVGTPGSPAAPCWGPNQESQEYHGTGQEPASRRGPAGASGVLPFRGLLSRFQPLGLGAPEVHSLGVWRPEA